MNHCEEVLDNGRHMRRIAQAVVKQQAETLSSLLPDLRLSTNHQKIGKEVQPVRISEHIVNGRFSQRKAQEETIYSVVYEGHIGRRQLASLTNK